jgi:Rrf2 family nitric oxide-sensitive transcriptional repressor
LRHALAEAADAFMGVLDGYSLSDLVKPRAPLIRLLAIKPAVRPRGAERARS